MGATCHLLPPLSLTGNTGLWDERRRGGKERGRRRGGGGGGGETVPPYSGSHINLALSCQQLAPVSSLLHAPCLVRLLARSFLVTLGLQGALGGGLCVRQLYVRYCVAAAIAVIAVIAAAAAATADGVLSTASCSIQRTNTSTSSTYITLTLTLHATAGTNTARRGRS